MKVPLNRIVWITMIFWETGDWSLKECVFNCAYYPYSVLWFVEFHRYVSNFGDHDYDSFLVALKK